MAQNSERRLSNWAVGLQFSEEWEKLSTGGVIKSQSKYYTGSAPPSTRTF